MAAIVLFFEATGHIGIHGGVDVRTYVRTYERTVDDVITIKPRFLASMGYHIFLIMMLRALAFVWILSISILAFFFVFCFSNIVLVINILFKMVY